MTKSELVNTLKPITLNKELVKVILSSKKTSTRRIVNQSPEDDEQTCRVCGCTWNNACVGGCYWVEPDLCSCCYSEWEV